MNKKILPLFLLLSLIGCNYKIINKPGLKGRIKKVIDYKIRIDKDDIGNSKLDTVSILTTNYNRKGQIIETGILMPQSNSVYKGTNVYDSKGRILKEVGHFDNKEIIVEYEYNDTLIHRTHSKAVFDGIITEMNEVYFYDKQQKLIKRKYSEISIGQKSMDTISISEFVYNYDQNERVKESIFKFWSVNDTLTTTKNTYEFNDIGLKIKTDKFNAQDSLIETEIYKYDFDKNGSWIVKKTYENDTLKYINTRKIEYR
jgi:hypothetical protein